MLGVLALAAPFAQLGHVLAYGARPRADGNHAYFPALLHASGALLGALLLVFLAVLVAARLIASPARRRPCSLALLFTGLLAAQLALFLVQEGVEAGRLPTAGTVAAGLLGQQPVALAAALLLRWLSARLGPALDALSAPRRPQPATQGSVVSWPPAPVWRTASTPVRSGRAHLQRGPPSPLP